MAVAKAQHAAIALAVKRITENSQETFYGRAMMS